MYLPLPWEFLQQSLEEQAKWAVEREEEEFWEEVEFLSPYEMHFTHWGTMAKFALQGKDRFRKKLKECQKFWEK